MTSDETVDLWQATTDSEVMTPKVAEQSHRRIYWGTDGLAV